MKRKQLKNHRFELRLTDDQFEQLKRLAAETGRSMAEVIVIALSVYDGVRSDLY